MKTRENEASSQKKRKFRNDGILVTVILIIAVAGLLFIKFTKAPGNSVVVKIDGKEVSFGFTTPSFFTDGELADYPRFWCSGGSVSFDDDWNEEVIGYCDWEMSSPIEKDYPPEIWKILPNILEVMNENVTGGCCGGCV